MMRIACSVAVLVALANVGYSANTAMDTCGDDMLILQGGDALIEVQDGATLARNAELKCANGKGISDLTVNTATIDTANQDDLETAWIAACCLDCPIGTANAADANGTEVGPCAPCDPANNKYQDAAAQTTCDDCTACNAGQGATTLCTATTNRVCGECDAGGADKYSTNDHITANPNQACTENDKCNPGEEATTAGNKTTLRVCEACGADKYNTQTLLDADQNAACQACPDISGANCAGAELTPPTHYRKNDGCTDKTMPATCEAHKACTETGVKTAGTATADAECNESPAAKIATGLTSLLAVLLLLL